MNCSTQQKTTKWQVSVSGLALPAGFAGPVVFSGNLMGKGCSPYSLYSVLEVISTYDGQVVYLKHKCIKTYKNLTIFPNLSRTNTC